MQAALTVAEGLSMLRPALEAADHAQSLNEADTRLQIVNGLLLALGWAESVTKVEGHESGERPDYELGTPRQVVVEAKSAANSFTAPTQKKRSIVTDLPSVKLADPELWRAVLQVQQYCINRGAEVAVVTNGHQLVALLATRRDGISPLSGRCVFVRDASQFLADFGMIWRLLSPVGVEEGHLRRLLTKGSAPIIPRKVSDALPGYPRFQPPTPLQADLGNLADFLMVDIGTEADVERDFYKNCYVSNPALAKYTSLSLEILSHQYTRQLETHSPPVAEEEIAARSPTTFLTEGMRAEALVRKPIFILGDVGVGKTVFLRRLMLSSENASDAIFIYIDLSSKAALKTGVGDFIYSDIARQLRDRYKIDVGAAHATGRSAGTQDSEERLGAALDHLVESRDGPVAIIIDNSDQRSFDVQKEALAATRQLASISKVYTFIAVQPHTYNRLLDGVGDADAPSRAFTISTPRIDQILVNRLEFGMKIASGEISSSRLVGIDLHLKTFCLVAKALANGIRQPSNGLARLLVSMSAGNVNLGLEFVVRFFGASTISQKSIADYVSAVSSSQVSYWRFLQTMITWRHSDYNVRESRIANLYDMNSPDPKGHFLLPLILSYLQMAQSENSAHGFVPFPVLVEEMQGHGFIPAHTEYAIGRALRYRLVDRASFAYPPRSADAVAADELRITTAGIYLVQEALTEANYLIGMSIDTPLTDDKLFAELNRMAEARNVNDKLDVARAFRDYLTEVWEASDFDAAYFDWHAKVRKGGEGFQRLERWRV